MLEKSQEVLTKLYRLKGVIKDFCLQMLNVTYMSDGAEV